MNTRRAAENLVAAFLIGAVSELIIFVLWIITLNPGGWGEPCVGKYFAICTGWAQALGGFLAQRGPDNNSSYLLRVFVGGFVESRVVAWIAIAAYRALAKRRKEKYGS